ncbi:substrate-binding domain-containing protein [Mesorhizobium sp. B2-4-9]|nr:substrate-binding domain-containing protein [Mesorhizobium sp. B2-4-9]
MQAVWLATTLVALAAFVTPMSAQEGVADITKLCGSKPMRVAMIDGNGGDNWRRIARLELQDEASKCANIKEVLYFDAAGDQLKYNTAINSFVAQGVDAIVAFAEFGDSSLPAFRDAFQAGVTLIPYMVKTEGVPGQDYSTNVYEDFGAIGHVSAKWLGESLGKGSIVYLGGPPGMAPSTRFITGLKEGIVSYPGLKMLEQDYVVTNWNPADAQKAVAGLIAKYGKIDAVVTDYGVTALAAVKAFEQAGLPVPAIATVASNNEINCKYLSEKAAGKGWKYLTLDYTTTVARTALRRAVSTFQGTDNPESDSFLPPVYADSEHGIAPKCVPGAPPDADFSSLLPADQLNALFKQ